MPQLHSRLVSVLAVMDIFILFKVAAPRYRPIVLIEFSAGIAPTQSGVGLKAATQDKIIINVY